MVEPTCVCVPGTIEDGEKCHFDIYSSLQAEKDLPQYMLQHLSCFDEELFRSLVTQQPKRFFILFAPPKVSGFHMTNQSLVRFASGDYYSKLLCWFRRVLLGWPTSS